MTYLGLDLGTKTLGISKSKGVIATNYKTLRHDNNYDYLIQELKNIINEEKVDKIILGYPKNMNNTEGERCQKTQEFKELLERRTGLTVVLWDERLTTVAADRTMMEGGIRREDRGQYVDKLAAVFILQGYLDGLAMKQS